MGWGWGWGGNGGTFLDRKRREGTVQRHERMLHFQKIALRNTSMPPMGRRLRIKVDIFGIRACYSTTVVHSGGGLYPIHRQLIRFTSLMMLLISVYLCISTLITLSSQNMLRMRVPPRPLDLLVRSQCLRSIGPYCNSERTLDFKPFHLSSLANIGESDNFVCCHSGPCRGFPFSIWSLMLNRWRITTRQIAPERASTTHGRNHAGHILC